MERKNNYLGREVKSLLSAQTLALLDQRDYTIFPHNSLPAPYLPQPMERISYVRLRGPKAAPNRKQVTMRIG